MDWKLIKKWLRNYLIIVIITFLISLGLNHLVEFSENTLLWMTSTIAQAFGALIAIVIAIGLFEKRRMVRALSGLFDEGDDSKIGGVVEFTNGQKQAIEHWIKEQKELWPRLYYPIQSIAVTIMISLVVMMTIDSSFIWTNYGLTFVFVLLILLAMYTLEILIGEIGRTFNLKKD